MVPLKGVEYEGAAYDQNGQILASFKEKKIGAVEKFFIEHLSNKKTEFCTVWKDEGKLKFTAELDKMDKYRK